jgi:hypothetical protein
MPSTLTETKTATVVATEIIGSGYTVVTAWEPYAGHSSTRSDGGDGRLGQITQRPLPEHIAAMVPASPERMAAAVDFHAANVADAYEAISEVYPALLDRADASADRGEVICAGSPSRVPCGGGCGELVEPNFLGIAWCGETGR